MQRRTFGDTSLEVSAISLGCWPFGVDWWGHYTDQQAIDLMRFAFDQGITFFDSGDAYGNGRAENLLGQFLKTVPRHKIEIGGKFGYDIYSDPGEAGSHRERKQDFSPKFLRFALEKSLSRLGADVIDLYMAHNIKLPQFRDDLFAELDKIKTEGKIKVWGVSLGPAIGWREEGIKAMTEHNAKAVQTVYNLFEQSPGREFCETARATHAGVLARVHDNSSILKDKVRIDTEISANDHRKFRDQSWKIYGLKKLERIRHYASDHGMTVHQLACKWLLMDPALTSITGTFLNEEEIREAAESIDKPALSSAEMSELARDYATDWGLGDEAHPCDLKSSVSPTGSVRSSYVPPPHPREIVIAMRYVVLYHTGIEQPHFDLMLELSPDSELSTWRIPHWPPMPGDEFTPLPNHRRDYLEYEGPVSNNRGQVKRIAAGSYDLLEQSSKKWVITLAGNETLTLPISQV